MPVTVMVRVTVRVLCSHTGTHSVSLPVAGWPESLLCVTVTPVRSAAALSPVRDSDRDVTVRRAEADSESARNLPVGNHWGSLTRSECCQ